MPDKVRVLFVCIENSCRSQMAEAFGHLYAEDLIEAYSAGSRPSGQLDPKAVTFMAELGYDLTRHYSKSLSEIPQSKYDYVITMGCGDECPFIPADHHQDWAIPDPKKMSQEDFRKVRDQIGRQVGELIGQIAERKNHD
jgi:arsenate reductase (thioredoxin)